MPSISDSYILIHYELADNTTHVMNARVEAECSLQNVKAINYISTVLGISSNIQTGALEQGSVIKIFWLNVTNGKESKWIEYIITVLFKKIFFEKENVKTADLYFGLDQTEKDTLTTVMNKYSIDSNSMNRLNKHTCLSKSRTEYFKQLSSNKEIVAVEIKPKNLEIKSTENVRIESSMFANYIESFEPEIQIENEAIVYIVSPVLVKGKKIKWTGSFLGKDIKFEMMSNQFKTQAQNGEIEFKTGFYIKCKLQYEESFDEEENPIHNNYKVLEVYGHGFNNNYTETRTKRHKDKIGDNQPTLFDNLEEWHLTENNNEN